MTTLHSVPPSQIDAELTKMWDAMEGTGKMRASLFNLIFFTQKNQRMEYYKSVAQTAIEKFPSRVIFVTVDKDPSQNYLKTSISAMESSKGESSVACDLIQIDVAGESAKRIPFLILPHILPDLPVYLIWAEDPIQEDPHSYQIEPFASRLIFDSESTSDLQRFAKSLLQYLGPNNPEVSDLNWARIENFRELFSTIFHSDKRLSELKNASSIKITYNSQESAFFCHTKIQSIYLQTWLACQLDWQLKETKNQDNKLTFLYQNEQGPLTVELIPEPFANLPPGRITAIQIKTPQGESFSFTRDKDFPHQVRMVICSGEVCELPSIYIISKSESGQSLVKEVCHRKTSNHFIKVLQKIASSGPTC